MFLVSVEAWSTVFEVASSMVRLRAGLRKASKLCAYDYILPDLMHSLKSLRLL
jgi:hypothetical protein